MITILVVGPAEAGLSGLASDHPSVEVLTASGSEEALEKLARNRRIDAVLLVAGPQTKEIAEAIREEDPGAPPIFTPESSGVIFATRPVRGGDPKRLLESVIEALSPEEKG